MSAKKLDTSITRVSLGPESPGYEYHVTSNGLSMYLTISGRPELSISDYNHIANSAFVAAVEAAESAAIIRDGRTAP